MDEQLPSPSVIPQSPSTPSKNASKSSVTTPSTPPSKKLIISVSNQFLARGVTLASVVERLEKGYWLETTLDSIKETKTVGPKPKVMLCKDGITSYGNLQVFTNPKTGGVICMAVSSSDECLHCVYKAPMVERVGVPIRVIKKTEEIEAFFSHSLTTDASPNGPPVNRKAPEGVEGLVVATDSCCSYECAYSRLLILKAIDPSPHWINSEQILDYLFKLAYPGKKLRPAKDIRLLKRFGGHLSYYEYHEENHFYKEVSGYYRLSIPSQFLWSQ